MMKVPTPLAFAEVAQEVSVAQDTHLGHALFGKAPERFDVVHVVFPASELIIMMMGLMMLIPSENHAIVGPSAIHVGGAISQDFTSKCGL
jgi:hypothetical protein